jgi:hypothetical protein
LVIFSAGLVSAQSQNDLDLIAGWISRSKDARKITFAGDAAKLMDLTRGTDLDGVGVAYDDEKGTAFYFSIFHHRPSEHRRALSRVAALDEACLCSCYAIAGRE